MKVTNKRDCVWISQINSYKKGGRESAPVISFRNYKEPRQGCVGAIFPTMELKILPEVLQVD